MPEINLYTKEQTDAGFATKTDLTEVWSEIELIEKSSDARDVVGTYAELQSYDTSTLNPNDIVKVLADETQSGAEVYYRWVVTEGTGSWISVGSKAATYTKTEADALLAAKADASAVYTKTEADALFKDIVKTVKVKIIGTGADGQPPTLTVGADATERYNITTYVENNIPTGYKLAGDGTMFCTSLGSDNVLCLYFYKYNNAYSVALKNLTNAAITLNNMWMEMLVVKDHRGGWKMVSVNVYSKEQTDAKMVGKLDAPDPPVAGGILHYSPSGPYWSTVPSYVEEDLTLDNTEDVIPEEFWNYSMVWMEFDNISSSSRFKVGGAIYGDIVSEQKSGYKLDLCVPNMVIYPGNQVNISSVRMVERIEVKRFDGGQGKIVPGDVELTFYYRNANNELTSMTTATREVKVCNGKRFTFGRI